MLGPNIFIFFLSNVAILTPFGFFVVYITLNYNLAFTVVSGLLCLLTMFSLYFTALTEPGIIPRSYVDTTDTVQVGCRSCTEVAQYFCAMLH